MRCTRSARRGGDELSKEDDRIHQMHTSGGHATGVVIGDSAGIDAHPWAQ